MRRGQAPFFAPVRVVWNKEVKGRCNQPWYIRLVFGVPTVEVASSLSCENGNHDGDVAIQLRRFALRSGQPANEKGYQARTDRHTCTPVLDLPVNYRVNGRASPVVGEDRLPTTQDE